MTWLRTLVFWFGYAVLRFPPQCFEDVPPPDQPHVRVWSVFGTADMRKVYAIVELHVCKRGGRHPDDPKLRAGRSFVECRPSKRFWRIHTPYVKEDSDDR